MVGRYLPPPPLPVAPPPEWGHPDVVRQRLGASVRELTFDTGRILFPTLGLAHYRGFCERHAASVVRVVQTLQEQPGRLEAFRQEFEELASQYFEANFVRQDYLMSRAEKVSTASQAVSTAAVRQI